MIHELTQELWLDTPKGRGQVLFMIDRGPHSDIEWVCVIETGEIWVTKNYDVKVSKNYTMGINIGEGP